MNVMIQYDINDCRDCPFKYDHRGHGECWAECSHKEHGQGSYGNVLYGCGEEFKEIPIWCPIQLAQLKILSGE